MSTEWGENGDMSVDTSYTVEPEDAVMEMWQDEAVPALMYRVSVTGEG